MLPAPLSLLAISSTFPLALTAGSCPLCSGSSGCGGSGSTKRDVRMFWQWIQFCCCPGLHSRNPALVVSPILSGLLLCNMSPTFKAGPFQLVVTLLIALWHQAGVLAALGRRPTRRREWRSLPHTSHLKVLLHPHTSQVEVLLEAHASPRAAWSVE